MNEQTVGNWLMLAEYDLQTARAMLRARRYLYVAFTCQQAVEKTLKALYVGEKGITPPYTHNLVRLLDVLDVARGITSEGRALLAELNAYYIESRYSETVAGLSRALDRRAAVRLVRDTERILRWLRLLLKS